MKSISYFFFYTYIGLIIIAGFWGAFINPVFDFKLLFNMDAQALPNFERINLLSKYRFLRAIELAFGILMIAFTKEIFTDTKFNMLYLTGMLCGIAGRVVSIFADGSPGKAMYFFLIYEMLGWMIIFSYTHKTRKFNAASGRKY